MPSWLFLSMKQRVACNERKEMGYWKNRTPQGNCRWSSPLSQRREPSVIQYCIFVSSPRHLFLGEGLPHSSAKDTVSIYTLPTGKWVGMVRGRVIKRKFGEQWVKEESQGTVLKSWRIKIWVFQESGWVHLHLNETVLTLNWFV